MAHTTISTNAPIVQIELLPDGSTPTVTSKDVALHFQKKHKDVLRDIERIRTMIPKEYHERNFAPMVVDIAIGSGATRQDKAYRLTRDAFSLLAMGFTGKAALQWKLRYIEAFNALERAALENARQDARQQALMDSAKAHARISPDRVKKVHKAVEYRGKGLSHREIGKLLDCSNRNVWYLLQDARALGLLDAGV